MSTTMTSSLGLRLDAPLPGDIVTVKVRRRPAPKAGGGLSSGSMLTAVFGRDDDEADSAQHYRMNDVWRVVAVNGGQAVVECARPGSYNAGRREVWSIAHHEWFEASELLAALTAPKEPPSDA